MRIVCVEDKKPKENFFYREWLKAIQESKNKMKRKILFRGKRTDNGKWVYGDYHHRAGNIHCIIVMEPDDDGKVLYVVHQVDIDTVGQFIGLLDKNGKDIYEGDIYRFEHPDSINEVSYCIGGGFAGFDFAPAYTDNNRLTNIEVIGNIHDNPELLSTNH